MSTASPTKRATRIGPRSAGLRMTAAEFDAITRYNDLYRYELIRGVLVVSPLALPQEGEPNEWLGHILLVYKTTHPQGSILDVTLPDRYVHIDDENRRRADRLIWCGLGRKPDLRLDRPTIAIEFVSRTRRDRVRDYEEKRAQYAALGISEYWLFDRFQRIVTIFRPDGTATVVREGEVLRSPELPGFEFDLKPLFDLADGWDKPKR